MHIGIIGAGIVGIQCAHELLDAGHGVTLIDPDGLAERTSSRNAGFIAHTDIAPLASPKIWRHVPRWLADPTGPLSIRPAYALQALPWMLRFSRASSPARVEASTRALIALNGLALPAWERRLSRLGLLDRHLRRRGYLYVWGDKSDFRAAQRGWIADQRAAGIPVEILADTAAVRRLEPAFGGATVGGAYYPTGCHVDNPAAVSKALGEAALARGARLVEREVARLAPIEGGVEVRLDDATTAAFDLAVVAAGAWSRPLAGMLGDSVPLDTERGYNLTLAKGALGIGRPIILEGQGVALSAFDDCDRIGGAVEFAGLKLPPNYARLDAILVRARRFLPEARFDGGTRWMGFRPSLPDSLPVIGRSSASDRIVYAFGHAHHGLTQSAATAEIAGALLLQRQLPLDVTPFSAQRF